MDLKLGTARIDITPKHPVPLAGFAHRSGTYERVEEPIFARVFYLEQTGKNGETTTVILVTADIIWWGDERVRSIERKLCETCGIAKACLIFHATHNHSGPQTSEMFTPSLGKIDRPYLDELEKRVLLAIRKARENVEPVTLERASAESRIGIHRRRRSESGVEMAPNVQGPTDPEVTLIRFKKSSGETKALIVHYTCHPTTTGDNVLSPEFPGVCTRWLETVLGEGCVVGYLQGCCGDIRPALVQDDAFYRGSYEDVQRIGRELSDVVLTAFNDGPWVTLPVSGLQMRSRTVNLSFPERRSLRELREFGQSSDRLLKEWSETLLTHQERVNDHIPLNIGYVTLSTQLAFLSFNAEVVVDYGLYVKEMFAKSVLPIPYSNGMVGYVPTAEQIAEGGYEAHESIYYFGLPAPFSTSIEAEIKREIIDIVGRETENETFQADRNENG